MRQAAVGVPVATVWSSPDAPAPADVPVLGADPDMAAWIRSLSHERRLGLVGRVVTQALWGDLVLVQEELDGWARVILPDQPSSLDPRGYPGWVPVAQLATCAPVTAAERYVVAAPTVLTGVAGKRLPVQVSFGTRVYCPAPPGDVPAGDGPGDGHAWASTRSGHRLRLPARALSPTGDVPARGADIVRSAMSFAGLAYLWGGAAGFGLDCSGLAWLVLRRHGIIAPRDAHDQAEAGQPASLDALAAGDLVFFAERPSGHIHHVGIALGDGRMVHSPRTGRPVEVTALATEPYASELASARRYRST
ncbi:MAG TPA: NlpC/P60 family protein [Streptosporangiaceae bacterium]|nr:NlpC/P60 family protein [Streptosporangiaceae bacterium]